MKYGSFSDAIRVGARLRPQGFGFFFEEGRTCAFGAGREAAVGNDAHYSEIYKMFPYLDRQQDRQCSACGPNDRISCASLAAMIFHLNDDHKWTREMIADWLQSEEDKLGYETITEEVEVSKQELALATK